MIRSLLLLFPIFFIATMNHDRESMKARFANSASYRWLNKEVLETYVLDDMESMDGRFKVMLPQGNYMVRSGEMEVRQIFLPASSYQLDLEYGNAATLEWKGKITS